MVVVDQFVDRTRHRDDSFFNREGCVVHMPFADPVSETLKNYLLQACKDTGATYHTGTYVCMEGPLFSTKAESHFYRKGFNASVIGMVGWRSFSCFMSTLLAAHPHASPPPKKKKNRLR